MVKRLNHGSLSHSLQSGGEQDEGKKNLTRKGKIVLGEQGGVQLSKNQKLKLPSFRRSLFLSRRQRKWRIHMIWDAGKNQVDTLPVWFSPKISKFFSKDAFPGVSFVVYFLSWQKWAKRGHEAPRVREEKWWWVQHATEKGSLWRGGRHAGSARRRLQSGLCQGKLAQQVHTSDSHSIRRGFSGLPIYFLET